MRGANTPPSKPLTWLVGCIRHAWIWILICVAAGFSGGLLLILQAWLFSQIIHGAFIDGQSQANLFPLFITLCAVVAGRSAIAWVREISGFKTGAQVRQEVRLALMQHVGDLGPTHKDVPHSGALSTVVVEQVEALQAFFTFYLPQLALAVSIPAAIVAFVFPISWAAGGLLLLSAPLIPFFMILIGMGAESISQSNFQALARLSANFLDLLQGLTTLKLLNRSRGAEGTIAQVSDDYRHQTMRVLRVAFLSTAVLELFSSLSIALVAVYLGSIYLGFAEFGMYGDPLTLRHGLFILLLAPEFYLPLRELGTHFHARAEALGAAKEIMKILTLKPTARHGGTRQMQEPADVHLECRRIHFAYDEKDQHPVLTDVSLQLAPREQVVLVGKSGAGKTTLINLLLGFIQPLGGEIRVNGQCISDVNLQNWLRCVTWIGQQPVLFHDSIVNNIAMAKPVATHEQIQQAARMAQVMEFAHHLPEGLDTVVGEHGWGLSRGQAQRVALARAFLKDAPLLLLDEPAAGLDKYNEQLVMSAINTLAQSRTVLLLTHRLQSIKGAPKIVVLEGGRVVQQGSYKELMTQAGVFSDLVQSSGFKVRRSKI